MKPVLIICGVSLLAVASIISILYLQDDEKISNNSITVDSEKVSNDSITNDEPLKYSPTELRDAGRLVTNFKGNDNAGASLDDGLYSLMNAMNNQKLTIEEYNKYKHWQVGINSSDEIVVFFEWEKPYQDFRVDFLVHPDGTITGVDQVGKDWLAILENDSNEIQNTDDQLNPEVFCTEKTKSLYYGLLDLAGLYDEMEEKYCNDED